MYDPKTRMMTLTVSVEVSSTFTLEVREGTHGWSGTITHGVGRLEGSWRARSKPRLVRKMMRVVARVAADRGHDRVLVEVFG